MRMPDFANLLPAALLALVAPMAMTGCDENAEIRVYESAQPASYNWPVTQERETSHTEDGIKWLWTVPAGWVDAPELSSFHVADYRFPGTNESLPGRLTVSVSDGDGGGVQENIQRWRGQLFLVPPKTDAPGDSILPTIPYRFSTPDGDMSFAVLNIAELSGQYQGEFVPTHLMGAVVQTPPIDNKVYKTWFFKMVGDQETIFANREKLIRMIMTLRPEGAAELSDNFVERALMMDETAEPSEGEPATEEDAPADESDATPDEPAEVEEGGY